MSMARSPNPSVVLRNVSFTMRHRLTPARACSTHTRMRDNLRLLRLSSSVSSRPLGSFFRLASFLHWRFITLKARVLVQDRFTGIEYLLLISNLLVMGLPSVGATEIQHPLAGSVHHEHVFL